MFIRFEGRNNEQTIECGSYRVNAHSEKGSYVKIIVVDDEEEFMLTDDPENGWQVAYIMNSAGRTIDKIYAEKQGYRPEVVG